MWRLWHFSCLSALLMLLVRHTKSRDRVQECTYSGVVNWSSGAPLWENNNSELNSWNSVWVFLPHPSSRDVLIRSHDRKLGPITWFQPRSESDVTSQSGIRYICMYIYSLFFTTVMWRYRVRPSDITSLQWHYRLNFERGPKSNFIFLFKTGNWGDAECCVIDKQRVRVTLHDITT